MRKKYRSFKKLMAILLSLQLTVGAGSFTAFAAELDGVAEDAGYSEGAEPSGENESTGGETGGETGEATGGETGEETGGETGGATEIPDAEPPAQAAPQAVLQAAPAVQAVTQFEVDGVTYSVSGCTVIAK